MAINTNHVTNDISASSGNVTIDGKVPGALVTLDGPARVMTFKS